VLPLNAPNNSRQGKIRPRFAPRGTRIGLIDRLFAAHARMRDLAIVADTEREFACAADLEGKKCLAD